MPLDNDDPFYVSGFTYLGAGEVRHFELLEIPPDRIPLFALAMPVTIWAGKHALWTQWQGVSLVNKLGANGPESIYSQWVRVQNEMTDRDESFHIYARKR
ncbi:hypothetical protein ACWEOI_12680 [Nocardia sp. NPDC004340]